MSLMQKEYYHTCGDSDNMLRRPGYAYVPVQRMGKVYTPQKAMCEGTIFPELNIPIGVYERGLFDGK